MPTHLTDEVIDHLRDFVHVNVPPLFELLGGLSQSAGDVSGGLQKIRKRLDRTGLLLAVSGAPPLVAFQVRIAHECEGNSGKGGSHWDHLTCYVSHEGAVCQLWEASRRSADQAE